MAIIGAAVLALASTGFRARFTRGLQSTETVHERFCERINSEGSKETLLWPAALPQMEEWGGEPDVKSLKVFSDSVVPVKYDLSLAVPTDAIADDEAGVFSGRFEMMGVQAKIKPTALFAAKLEAGFSDLCYDGRSFFATNHPLQGGGSESNKGTAALDASAFEAAYANLRGRKNFRNQPAGLFAYGGKPVLIVPPALQATAERIVKVQTDAAGAGNPNYGKAELLVLDHLTSDTKWYLGMADSPVRGFVHLVREEPSLRMQDRPDDDSVFEREEARYSVRGRFAVAYGMWQAFYGSTGTT